MKVIIGLFLTLSITVAQSSADKQFEDIAQLPTFFVGFLKHYSLRHEVQKRPGAKFVLKDYHDEEQFFSSPPVQYVRALMLDELIQAIK
ncbi:MAG: hypothetical protein QF416_08330 [Candidatus Marinimicrobia bacterium]|jgi:hypothetical protein|nr:hypothetical protein [Candidatus Neomarinimicrobiota bacterium]|tara:strand:+ start:1540 stop:1806 length:267 start_codon:yes stop_codon:yes gene_type:complete